MECRSRVFITAHLGYSFVRFQEHILLGLEMGRLSSECQESWVWACDECPERGGFATFSPGAYSE